MRMKRSTVIPLALLVYLAVMSYIGLPEYRQGHYAYYFGIIGVTLLLIALLRVFLLKQEQKRRKK